MPVKNNPNTQLQSWFRQVGTSPTTLIHSPGTIRTTTSTGAPSLGTLVATPFLSGRGGVIDTIYFQVTTGVATAVGRCGIYTSTSDTNLYPYALVVDSGEFDCSTATVKSTSISVQLDPNNVYWLVANFGTAAPTTRVNGTPGCGPMLGMASTIGSAIRHGLTVASSYAALPSTFPGSAAFTTSPTPLICLSYSS
jgi:hypothetical protein